MKRVRVDVLVGYYGGRAALGEGAAQMGSAAAQLGLVAAGASVDFIFHFDFLVLVGRSLPFLAIPFPLSEV